MGRLVVLLLLVVLLAGGGVGTWWFGIEGNPIPGLSDASEGGSGSEASGLVQKPSEFVEMKPLSVPVMQEGRVTELLTLVISLEVAGNAGLEAVADNRPALRDSMLSELHALYSLRFVRNNENEMDLVKRRLEKKVRPILKDKLRGVFVQAVQGREVKQKS
jgi:flagellar basal body-associated protein FliL